MTLLDLMFGTQCAGCGREGSLACRDCRSELGGPAALAWPTPSPPPLPPPWAVVGYEGPGRDLLLAFKERGAIGLGAVLAVPLAASVTAAAARVPRGTSVLLVPVPSAARAVRARGDDVVLVLARRAAPLVRRAGRDVQVVQALQHSRQVADSAGLSSRARAANLAGAFVVPRQTRPIVAGSTVVVVDDLMTTGASIAEAARALRSCGAAVVGSATVAATRRQKIREKLDTGASGATVWV